MLKRCLRTTHILPIMVIFLCFCVFVSNVLAYDLGNLPMKVQKGELPEWCMYTMGRSKYHSDKTLYSKIYHQYIKTYGKPWEAMHHYCFGLDKFNRAFSNWKNEQKRKFYFTDAIKEFDYVLNRSDAQFRFKPTVFISKGRALSALGKYVDAIIAFKKATQLRPNYVGGYMLIADQFILLGDKDKARSILQVGLTHVPNSPSLKKKLDEIK